MSLSRNQLKLIALVAMFADHFTWLLLPGANESPLAIGMHLFGRLTAPIMWYFIAEGMIHTRNRERYLLRLLVFGLVSMGAYQFAFGIPMLGAILPLFSGAAMVYLLDKVENRFVAVVAIVALYVLTQNGDFGVVAPLAILRMAQRDTKKSKLIELAFAMIAYLIFRSWMNWGDSMAYNLMPFGMLLALPVIGLYDGRPQPRKTDLFYYAYPAHLIIIGFIRLGLYGNVPLL